MKTVRVSFDNGGFMDIEIADDAGKAFLKSIQQLHPGAFFHVENVYVPSARILRANIQAVLVDGQCFLSECCND